MIARPPSPLRLLLDSVVRAVAYCAHPRIIFLSLLPFVLIAALSWAGQALWWDSALAAAQQWLGMRGQALQGVAWLPDWPWAAIARAAAPFVLVGLALPAIVILALLFVSLLVLPQALKLVARRRFPELSPLGRNTLVRSTVRSLLVTAAAIVLTVVSVPLWLYPPALLVVPPLIWGWATARMMSGDVLDAYAASHERRELLAAHRWPLLAVGVVGGYLSALPTLLLASSWLALLFLPVAALLAAWLYVLIFAFTALWFAHYLLAALQARRAQPGA